MIRNSIPTSTRVHRTAIGALLGLSLLASAPALAQEPDPGWEPLATDLTALIEEAGADAVRMGVSIVDLSGAYGGGVLDLGSQDPFKAASVIKLPLLGLLMSMVDAGTLSIDETVTIPADDINIVGGAGTLREREFPLDISIDELMTLMVQVSDNTATNVLIDIAGGFPAVNGYIAGLGYDRMWLGRKMINPAAPPLQENWINATTVADFIARIYREEILSPESSQYIIDLMLGQLVDTKFGAVIPRDVLANKTGELGDTSHDSGIIFVPGNEVVLVVTTEFESGRRSEVDPYIQRAATLVYEFLLE